MNRLLKILVLNSSCMLVLGCATAIAQVNNEPTPYTTTDANGNRWSGSLMNGQWHGPVEMNTADGTRCTGSVVNKSQDGLWTCHSKINDLTFYNIYAAGKVLKYFSELEPHWAAGNYEEVFRIRGRKSLLGMNLKTPENSSDVMIDSVQIHSPAFIGGLQAGDKIISLNGESDLNLKTLIGRIVATPFGQPVQLVVLRAGNNLTFSLIPGTIPRNFVDTEGRPVTASAELLKNHYRRLDSAEGYSKYLEFVSDETYKPEFSILLQAALKRERTMLQSYVHTRDIAKLATYLKNYPASPLRNEAIAGASGILKQSKSKGNTYLAFLGQCPNCAGLLPSEYVILAVGPAGMTVADLLRLNEQGIGADVLAAKIESSMAEYKDFSFEEIAFLGTLNVPSSVVSAMIRSTSANASKKIQEQNRQLQEENIALKNKAADKAATLQTATAPQVDSAGGSPSVVEECLKLSAALAACDQSGGFLKTGCRIIAQSSFQCPLPGYR